MSVYGKDNCLCVYSSTRCHCEESWLHVTYDIIDNSPVISIYFKFKRCFILKVYLSLMMGAVLLVLVVTKNNHEPFFLLDLWMRDRWDTSAKLLSGLHRLNECINHFAFGNNCPLNSVCYKGVRSLLHSIKWLPDVGGRSMVLSRPARQLIQKTEWLCPRWSGSLLGFGFVALIAESSSDSKWPLSWETLLVWFGNFFKEGK